jgi:hypothetical protein
LISTTSPGWSVLPSGSGWYLWMIKVISPSFFGFFLIAGRPALP